MLHAVTVTVFFLHMYVNSCKRYLGTLIGLRGNAVAVAVAVAVGDLTCK